MKTEITLTLEADTLEELWTKFDIVEGLALSNDKSYLKLISAMNNRFEVFRNRRKRTRKEREQRATIEGFESFEDIAI